MMIALSLSALPAAWDAVRVDAGYARGREYSGLPPGQEAEPCARPSPTWSDDHATGRRRSAGGGGKARRRRYAGGWKTLLRPSGVWSSMLSTRLGRRSRLNPEGAPKPEGGSTPKRDSEPERGAEEGRRLSRNGQTKTARGGFLLN